MYQFLDCVHNIYYITRVYYTSSITEIVMNLKTIGDEQLRPQLDTIEIDKNVIDLMRNCWDEDPTCRPSFQFMRKQSRKLHW